MRPTSAAWRELITKSRPVITRVEAWYDGKLTAAEVPITAGDITYDDTAVVRRRLSITVPARDGLTNWDPGDSTTHPLAAYGQRLAVWTGIRHPGGGVELMSQGWYLITSWERSENGQRITVRAEDLSRLLADARPYAPSSPPYGQKYADEFVRLVGTVLPTAVDPSLPAYTVHPLLLWDGDRVKNLTNLCRGWGARWYVSDSGRATAARDYRPLTPDTKTAVTFTDGQNGTVIERTRGYQRDRLYNAVVVTGKAREDGKPGPYAVAETLTGPLRTTGPYGPVPRFYASDVITTTQQARDAAVTMLARYSSIGRMDTVECVPNPAVELGDVARLTTAAASFTGRITGLSLPLTATQGAMTVQVSTQPDDDEEGAA